jgi:glycosyltransferase involved in cell wall biosynthesis
MSERSEHNLPLVSVVIPTFNRAPKLRRAVKSVFEQSYKAFEILVIDDGNDDSEELLQAEFGDCVHYLRGTASGVAAARNLGIAAARGDYIAFLDADDWWYSNKLATVMSIALQRSNVGLFYSKMHIVNERGEVIRTTPIRTRGPVVYPDIVEGNFIFNSTVVAKKSCLDQVGGFDTTLTGCEDWELWIRVARNFSALLIPDVLVAYEHLSAGSFTSRYEAWVSAHDEVIAKTLRNDPSISLSWVNRIHSGVSYAKGSIYLGAGQESLALEQFKLALRPNWRRWRAAAYVAVLSSRMLRVALPRRVKVALRLPEAHR